LQDSRFLIGTVHSNKSLLDDFETRTACTTRQLGQTKIAVVVVQAFSG